MNLRIMEKEDLPLFAEWINNPEVHGEYNPLIQVSRTVIEKKLESSTSEKGKFIIERKDGAKIGFLRCSLTSEKLVEIGFVMIPSERDKGYCTEAISILVDYLFLSKDIVRVQACTDVRNVASQKVLEKVGFRKEGIIRKSLFTRGKWRDLLLYSILREEWKEPKILVKEKDSLIS